MTRRSVALIVVVCVLAAFAGVGYRYQRIASEGQTPGAYDAIDKQMPAIEVADLEGVKPSPDQWAGKVLIVNFWATWCAPCREEIPMFVALQTLYQERAVSFVGIALDAPEPVRAFVDEFDVNYPVLIGGTDAIELGRQFGNSIGALPFSAIVDRRGVIVDTHFGVFEREALEAKIRSLL